MGIIAKKDRTRVVTVGATAVVASRLGELSGDGTVTHLVAAENDIYCVFLEDGAPGALVSVLEYPFFDCDVRLSSYGAIAEGDLLQPRAGGYVEEGETIPLWRAVEAIDADGGNGQHVTVSQIGNAVAPVSAGTLRWVKHTIELADMQALGANTSGTVVAYALPANHVIMACRAKHSEALDGAALSAATVQVGITGTANKYLAAFDVFAAVSATNQSIENNIGTESSGAAVNILATITLTGANADELDAGEIDIWLLTGAIAELPS